MESCPPVAVFDADTAPALAFVQSLARRGVPVTVFGSRWSIAGSSRFARLGENCPRPDDRRRFRGWLRQELEAGRITRIAPTSDLIAFHCADLREHFPEPVRALLPTLDQMLACLDKLRFADICRSLGLPAPQTAAPQSLEEAHAVAREIGYPVMVKPRTHLGVGMGERGGLACSPRELDRLFRRYSVSSDYRDLSASLPSLRWPLIQEYFPSALSGAACVTGFRSPSGEVTALMSSCRLEAFPPLNGISSLQETHEAPEALTRAALQLVEATSGFGIFGLEFLRSARGYQAIDLNPRGFGFIALNIAGGHDLPWQWYEASRGRSVAAQPVIATGLRWQWASPLRLRCWAGIMLGPDRLGSLRLLLDSLLGPMVSAYGPWSDPLPRLLGSLRLWRHPRALLTTILREQLRRLRTGRQAPDAIAEHGPVID